MGKASQGKGARDNAGMIAQRRLKALPVGTKPICREYQRTGTCSYQQRTGKPCGFVHVDKLPASMANMAGLTTADLPKGAQVYWTQATNQFACDCAGHEPSAQDLSKLQSELAQVASLVDNEGSVGPVVSPGFQWHP